MNLDRYTLETMSDAELNRTHEEATRTAFDALCTLTAAELRLRVAAAWRAALELQSLANDTIRAAQKSGASAGLVARYTDLAARAESARTVLCSIFKP